jgi:hypothetical protein
MLSARPPSAVPHQDDYAASTGEGAEEQLRARVGELGQVVTRPRSKGEQAENGSRRVGEQAIEG